MNTLIGYLVSNKSENKINRIWCALNFVFNDQNYTHVLKSHYMRSRCAVWTERLCRFKNVLSHLFIVFNVHLPMLVKNFYERVGMLRLPFYKWMKMKFLKKFNRFYTSTSRFSADVCADC